MVQFLIKYRGVNINLKDSLGKMLLSIAKTHRDATIVQLFLECGSDNLKSIG